MLFAGSDIRLRDSLVSKPILHSEMNSRCQEDPIDMQTQLDHEFKVIMVYQNHLIKFCFIAFA